MYKLNLQKTSILASGHPFSLYIITIRPR